MLWFAASTEETVSQASSDADESVVATTAPAKNQDGHLVIKGTVSTS